MGKRLEAGRGVFHNDSYHIGKEDAWREIERLVAFMFSIGAATGFGIGVLVGWWLT